MCLKDCPLGSETPFIKDTIYSTGKRDDKGVVMTGDNGVEYWFPNKVWKQYFGEAKQGELRTL